MNGEISPVVFVSFGAGNYYILAKENGNEIQKDLEKNLVNRLRMMTFFAVAKTGAKWNTFPRYYWALKMFFVLRYAR